MRKVGLSVRTSSIFFFSFFLRQPTSFSLFPYTTLFRSAGGAEAGPASHHPHRSGEMRSFAPTSHRHSAEIIQELGLASANGQRTSVAFSATAVEAVRGILVTAHVFLNEDLDEKALWKIY